jgi:hypothetical protein
MFTAMRRSIRAHELTGTVQVNAIVMFPGGGGGFAIAPPPPASLAIVVGGLSRRPRAVDDQMAVRDVLDLTVSIDHNAVEGAPATRFGALAGARAREAGDRRHPAIPAEWRSLVVISPCDVVGLSLRGSIVRARDVRETQDSPRLGSSDL